MPFLKSRSYILSNLGQMFSLRLTGNGTEEASKDDREIIGEVTKSKMFSALTFPAGRGQ